MTTAARGYDLLRPDRLPPSEFRSLITSKGWRMADVACRWGIQPETLSRIASDPARSSKWDDLARALPRLTRAERAAATAARLRLTPTPRKAAVSRTQPSTPAVSDRPPKTDDPIADLRAEFVAPQPTSGLRYQGYVAVEDELAVTADMGSFAAEGALLYVVATRLGSGEHGEIQEEYHVESESGDRLWLAPDDMDRWVAATGRTRPR